VARKKEFSMKNFFKLFGILALAAVIGFSLAGCGDNGDPSSPPPGGYDFTWPDGLNTSRWEKDNGRDRVEFNGNILTHVRLINTTTYTTKLEVVSADTATAESGLFTAKVIEPSLNFTNGREVEFSYIVTMSEPDLETGHSTKFLKLTYTLDSLKEETYYYTVKNETVDIVFSV
jgi:hypothetical protein